MTDPLTTLETVLLAGDGGLDAALKRVLEPKAMSPSAVVWDPVRLVRLISMLLGTRTALRLCLVVSYKLAYYVNASSMGSLIDGPLRIIQRRLMDPVDVDWHPSLAVVYVRMYGFDRIGTGTLCVGKGSW